MKRAILILMTLSPLAANAEALPDAGRGQAVFAQTCAECHDDTPAQERLQGPPLFGVVNRKAGAVKGFGYSDAMKRANAQGRTWSEAELDTYLADPEKAVPGGYMPVAVTEKGERLDLIAYLKTLDVAKKP